MSQTPVAPEQHPAGRPDGKTGPIARAVMDECEEFISLCRMEQHLSKWDACGVLWYAGKGFKFAKNHQRATLRDARIVPATTAAHVLTELEAVQNITSKPLPTWGGAYNHPNSPAAAVLRAAPRPEALRAGIGELDGDPSPHTIVDDVRAYVPPPVGAA